MFKNLIFIFVTIFLVLLSSCSNDVAKQNPEIPSTNIFSQNGISQSGELDASGSGSR